MNEDHTRPHLSIPTRSRLQLILFRFARRLNALPFDARVAAVTDKEARLIETRLKAAIKLLNDASPLRSGYSLRDLPRILITPTNNRGERTPR
jgi:hypothetical protein